MSLTKSLLKPHLDHFSQPISQPILAQAVPPTGPYPSIPGFCIQHVLGQSEMATIYLAVQETLDRPVTLKVMDQQQVINATNRSQFLREGQMIAQLNHPHIIKIYNLGVHESYFYLAMQHAPDGLTLRDRMRQGFTAATALKILLQIASALDYGHQKGMIFRALQPSHILLDQNDSVLLTDFGVSKMLTADNPFTPQGFVIETPTYKSPEQLLDQPLDHRTDLYSLGVLWYEMLTGQPPFQAENPLELASMHLNKPIPLLPEPLAQYQGLLEYLLAKQPDDRCPSAKVLIKAVNLIEGTDYLADNYLQLVAPKIQPAKTGLKPVTAPSRLIARRWRWPAAVSAALMVSVITPATNSESDHSTVITKPSLIIADTDLEKSTQELTQEKRPDLDEAQTRATVAQKDHSVGPDKQPANAVADLLVCESPAAVNTIADLESKQMLSTDGFTDGFTDGLDTLAQPKFFGLFKRPLTPLSPSLSEQTTASEPAKIIKRTRSPSASKTQKISKEISKKQRINKLAQEAPQLIAKHCLISCKNGPRTALDVIQEIRKLDRKNPAIPVIKRRMADQYFALASRDQKLGKIKQCQSFKKSGLDLVPRYSKLLLLDCSSTHGNSLLSQVPRAKNSGFSENK